MNILRFFIILAIAVAAGYFVVSTNVKVLRRTSDHVWFEAESALKVEKPIVVSEDAEASGGKCLEIAQWAGSGIYGSGGEATYEISIPEAGRYILWARVFWLDGCSNSFLVRASGKTLHFGEDSNFNAWHWMYVVMPEFSAPGTHEMAVINREDGIKIDKFLLTKNPSYTPTGTGETMYSFSFDNGRADAWRPQHQDRWSVQNARGMDRSPAYVLNSLAGSSREFAVTPVQPLREFIYRVQAKCLSDDAQMRDVVLLFQDRRRGRYTAVDFKEGTVALKRWTGDGEELLRSASPIQARKIALGTQYHLYEVQSRNGLMQVAFDGAPVLSWDGDLAFGDAIGVGSLFGDVCFDNVLYARDVSIDYSNNFYYDVGAPLENVAGWQPQAGSWIRGADYGTLAYEAGAGNASVTIAGSQMWSDYSYDAVFKANGRSTVGLLFYYVNKDNAYLFQWGGEESGHGDKQLICLLNGSPRVLAEESGGYEKDRWYRMRVETLDGRIRTFIDGRLVFDTIDTRLLQGRVGLMVRNETGLVDRAPTIQFWPGIYSGNAWEWHAKLQAARESREQTLYFCYRGNDDHYSLCRTANGAGRRVVQLVHTRQGKRIILEERSDTTAATRAYEYAVERRGDSINVVISAMVSSDNLTVNRRGITRFTIRHPALTDGRIGIDMGRPATAQFDDIRVRSVGELAPVATTDWEARNPRKEREHSHVTFSNRLANSDWIKHFNGWQLISGTWSVEGEELMGKAAGRNAVLQYEFGYLHDDMSLEVDVRSVSSTDPDVSMIIAGDGDDLTKGYRLEFGTKGTILWKNDSTVASREALSFEAGRDYSLIVERRNGLVSGYCNGSKVVSFPDDAAIRGGDVLISLEAGSIAVAAIRVATFPALYYGFSLAEWAATDFSMWDPREGTWDEISSLGYSMFGEKVRNRDAVAWHKESLPRDFAVDMYIALHEWTKAGTPIVRFCAKRECDACGYKLVLDMTAREAVNNMFRLDYRATLLKDGRVCSRAAAWAMSVAPGIQLRIEKSNNAVRITGGKDTILEYLDNEPPDGDMLALGVGGDPYHPIFFDEILMTAK